jgi:hypothetical protein
MTYIKDGRGTGLLARVDEGNKLVVSATSQTEEHEISSAEGLAFFAHISDTARTLTTTATGGPVLYLKNTHATKQLVIAKFLVSTDTAGVQLHVKTNMTLGTIGNENTHAPTTSNVGSSLSATGTFYNWDEVGDGMTGLSNGDTLATYILGAGFNAMPIDGAVILENGDSITFMLHGAGECALNVRFFYMNVEE